MLTPENTRSAEEIANDPRTHDVLYLVANGFTFTEASALDPVTIQAYVAWFKTLNSMDA